MYTSSRFSGYCAYSCDMSFEIIVKYKMHDKAFISIMILYFILA